jgi:hypothetical protein
MGYIRDLRVAIGDIITNCQTKKPENYPDLKIIKTKTNRTIGIAFPMGMNVSYIIRRLEEECGYLVKQVYSTTIFNKISYTNTTKFHLTFHTLIVVRKIEDIDLD